MLSDFDLIIIRRDRCGECSGNNDESSGSRVADSYDDITAR
jgi:hypothetical protein